jgi:hypothetical protein
MIHFQRVAARCQTGGFAPGAIDGLEFTDILPTATAVCTHSWFAVPPTERMPDFP